MELKFLLKAEKGHLRVSSRLVALKIRFREGPSGGCGYYDPNADNAYYAPQDDPEDTPSRVAARKLAGVPAHECQANVKVVEMQGP